MSTVADARLIELPRISRPEGDITPVEGARTIPFEIARVFYLYDVVAGAERAGHAHRRLEELIVAAMGSFTVRINDGHEQREFELNRAYRGLYVPPLVWREVVNFSSGAVCVVLASRPYEEDDYIRDADEFAARRSR